MLWGQNLPFPIDLAGGPYHSAALLHCLLLCKHFSAPVKKALFSYFAR